MEQTEIAEKVDVSRVTISKWCTSEGWKEARAAKNVTRPELDDKLLLTIDTLITQVNSSDDPTLIAGLGDKLAKLSAVIEKLDKKANVVDAIEVFMAFSKWIEYRSTIRPGCDPGIGKGHQQVPGPVHNRTDGHKITRAWQQQRKRTGIRTVERTLQKGTVHYGYGAARRRDTGTKGQAHSAAAG